MIITMLQKDTGLSQTYYLETDSSPSGTYVVVKDLDKSILGQFKNVRQSVFDKRPAEVVVSYSDKMQEVIDYFNRV